MRRILTHGEVIGFTNNMIERLRIRENPHISSGLRTFDAIYGVPRGGIPVAYEVARKTNGKVIYDPSLATCIVDDIIDSGETEEKYRTKFPLVPFDALIRDKKDLGDKPDWVIFPWEQRDDSITGPTNNIVRLLQYIGEDVKRPGLIETPERFLKYFDELTSGYKEDPNDHLKLFEEDDYAYDQMVTVANIPFYSLCEHHLAPFFGTVTISYIPKKKIIGLSKLARIVNVFSRRLQVQERMTHEIGDFLQRGLQEPMGVGIMATARHLCMESRGIRIHGPETRTTALFGVMKTDSKAKDEFLENARSLGL